MTNKTRRILTGCGLMLLSALLSVILSPLRGTGFLGFDGFELYFIVSFIVYFPFTVIALNKTRGLIKPGRLALILIAGASLVELPFRIIDFYSTIYSLPDFFGRIIAIVAGYLFVRAGSRPVRWVILGLGALIFVGFSSWGYARWIHRVSYGSVTGKLSQNIDFPIPLYDVDGNYLNLDSFRGSYLLLDVWSSGCGFCFQAFPIVQQLHEELAGNDKVILRGLHCRRPERGETYSTGISLLHKHGYDFPCLSMDINDPTLGKLGITGFPSVLIFNPEGKLIFRGNIESA